MPQIRAARLHDHGGPLKIEQVDLAEPSGEEVVVEMRFAGVNPVDRYIAEGRVASEGPLPRTLGGEGSGLLEGRPVLVAGGGLGSARDGVWAERVVAPRQAVLPLPDGVGLAEAAAMGVAGLTAWKCVHEVAALVPEDRVVVLGASGGVGSMIVSLCRAAGSTVWGQTGAEEKRAFVEEQGAERVLVGDASGVAEEMEGFAPTAVFDPLGGDFVRASLQALAVGGRHVTFGTSAGPEVSLNMQVLYRKMLSIRGYAGLVVGPQERRAGLEQAVGALRDGSLRVRVDSVLPLEDVAEAFSRLAERRVQGKLLLALGG